MVCLKLSLTLLPGYTELATSFNMPLINLYSGDIVDVLLKYGLSVKYLKIHKTIAVVDLICSILMMNR